MPALISVRIVVAVWSIQIILILLLFFERVPSWANPALQLPIVLRVFQMCTFWHPFEGFLLVSTVSFMITVPFYANWGWAILQQTAFNLVVPLLWSCYLNLEWVNLRSSVRNLLSPEHTSHIQDRETKLGLQNAHVQHQVIVVLGLILTWLGYLPFIFVEGNWKIAFVALGSAALLVVHVMRGLRVAKIAYNAARQDLLIQGDQGFYCHSGTDYLGHDHANGLTKPAAAPIFRRVLSFLFGAHLVGAANARKLLPATNSISPDFVSNSTIGELGIAPTPMLFSLASGIMQGCAPSVLGRFWCMLYATICIALVIVCFIIAKNVDSDRSETFRIRIHQWLIFLLLYCFLIGNCITLGSAPFIFTESDILTKCIGTLQGVPFFLQWFKFQKELKIVKNNGAWDVWVFKNGVKCILTKLCALFCHVLLDIWVSLFSSSSVSHLLVVVIAIILTISMPELQPVKRFWIFDTSESTSIFDFFSFFGSAS